MALTQPGVLIMRALLLAVCIRASSFSEAPI